jgi:predicted phosphodiesterase
MDINYFEGIKTWLELRAKMKENTPSGYSQKEIENIFKIIRTKGIEFADVELKTKCIDYKQQVQKYQDTNRIERKTFRQDSRISNALEEYNKSLIENFTNLRPFTIAHDSLNNKAVGLIQLSDIHFNELINIEGNQYDFKIAAKRLKLLCAKAKMYFSNMDIKNVVVAFTGDILNNDKLLDKLLNQATNRAKATLLGFHILEQFICDLNQSFNISIASVTGNEGRAKDELGYSNIMATDNYDFTIFNMLKIAFRNCKGITFIDGNGSEQIIEVAKSNILLLHGLSIKGEVEKSIQQIIGKYASKGIIIDYVFIGHIHSARIGDLYARSSSLCGANAYSDYALNLSSRASQNIAVFYDNKSHDVFKIDLQNTDNIQGYQIISKLEEYNAKSIDKCKHNTTIFKVVI